MSDVTQTLLQLLDDGTLGLFESCDAAATRAEQDAAVSESDGVVSFVGFAGDTIKGNLVIVASEAVFLAAYPLDEEPDKQDLLDWAGEMANQLIGRVKNMCIERGVDFALSAPAAMSGNNLECGAQNAAHDMTHHYKCDAGDFSVRLTAVTEAGFAFKESSANGAQSAQAEGDMILF